MSFLHAHSCTSLDNVALMTLVANDLTAPEKGRAYVTTSSVVQILRTRCSCCFSRLFWCAPPLSHLRTDRTNRKYFVHPIPFPMPHPVIASRSSSTST